MNAYRLGLTSCLLATLLGAGCDRPASSAAPSGAPQAAGHPPLSLDGAEIKLSQSSGELQVSNSPIYVSFPTDMVDASAIPGDDDDWGFALSPVVITPNPGYRFSWLTPRRGTIYFFGGFPSIAYRITLRDNLEDLEGKPVNPAGWGAELASEDFGITEVQFFDARGRDTGELSERQSLPLMPRVRLAFSRDVFPNEVAGRVAFVDTETKQRHPVVACLDHWQSGRPQGLVFLEPAQPLTGGRSYWLVVERLGAASGTYQTNYLRVYPAGQCPLLKNTYARGYNQPRTGKFVRVFFDGQIDAGSLDPSSFSISPPVAELSARADADVVYLEGEFEEGTDYTLTVAGGVRAFGGMATAEATEWQVRIPERRASVIMPSDFLAQPFETGVDVVLAHSRTGELTWNLAEVPGEKLPEVRSRLREFSLPMVDENGRPLTDVRDGTLKFNATDELIPALGLSAVASGTLPAAPTDEERTRQIRWRPSEPAQQAGLYLLEVTGQGVDGRPCGNRSLVTLSSWFMNFVATGDSSGVRLAMLSDGSPAPGVSVQAFTADGVLLDEATTDAQGIGWFEKLDDESDRPRVLMAGNSLGRTFQEGHYPNSSESYFFEEEDGEWSGLLFSNGDLYRAGEEVSVYAIVRQQTGGRPAAPASADGFSLTVNIGDRYVPESSESFPLEFGSSGGASLRWKIPPDLPPSRVFFSLEQDGVEITEPLFVDVAEFRPPAFSMTLNAGTATGTTAEAKLESRYFHGSANKGAKVRYTAEWVMRDWLVPDFVDEYFPEPDDSPGQLRNHTPASKSLGDNYPIDWSGYAFTDRFSEAASQQGTEGVLASMKVTSGRVLSRHLAVPSSFPDRGETVLGDDGTVTLVSECPFPNLGRSHRAQVFWTVDLTTVAGVSRREATQQAIQFPTRALAIKPGRRDESNRGLPLRITTIDPTDREGTTPTSALVEVFRRTINTVRENVSERVVRYRNSPSFEPTWSETLDLPFEGVLPAPVAGDYVVVATPVDVPHARVVSAAFPGVLGRSEIAILDDHSFEATLEEDAVPVGGTAVLQVRTPFPGAVRVTVETDELLETLPVVQIEGTSGRVQVPVRRDYFPNAFLRVHLMAAPGDGGKPAERFAVCPLNVRDPQTQLTVTPVLDQPEVRVRENVSGQVLVTAGGQPVVGADVIVFAIDDAILSLGNWENPDLKERFFPDRRHVVTTNVALGAQWSPAQDGVLSQFEKGYILGSGREKTMVPTVTVRENENPRPLWLASVQTDTGGRVRFSFEAPDSLTSYRITAVAHTPQTQVGTGETNVRVSNPLRAEPFLPSFVREGDELVLRCQLTQEAEPSVPVEYSVEVEGPAELLGEASQSLTLARATPTLVTTRLKASLGDHGEPIRVVFKCVATDTSGLADASAHTISLLPRFTERTELIAGDLSPDDTWEVAGSVPPRWIEQPGGRVDVMVSGSRWLPQLATFAPGSDDHTVLGDLASSALAPYLASRLAAYLPWPEAEEGRAGDIPNWILEAAETAASEAATVLERSLIPDGAAGWLPRYPDGRAPDDPTTALAAWAVMLASQNREAPHLDGSAERGFRWSPRLKTKLGYWSDDAMYEGNRASDLPAPTAFVRAIALYATVLERDPTFGQRDVGSLRSVAKSLFTRRDEGLGLEGRCFLALALPLLDQFRKERDAPPLEPTLSREDRETLLREIGALPLPERLDPNTFATPQRSAAIRLLTLGSLRGGEVAAGGELGELRDDLDLLGDGRPLPPQENIWRLLAADTFLQIENPARITATDMPQDGYVASQNGVTVAWLEHPAHDLATRFPSGIRTGVPSHWLLRATYRSATPAPVASDQLAIERELYSVAGEPRGSSETAPLEVGEYVLLNYRISSDRPHSYVTLEEQLPAALEVVNPDLPSTRKAFSLPPRPTDAAAGHAEHRRHRLRITFTSLPAGESTYSVLAQVVASGSFAWPAAQASPLYDQRITATTTDLQVLANAP